MSYRTIAPEAVAEMLKQGQSIDLIDVRTPAEFREIHAVGARLVPLDSFDAQKYLRERNGHTGHPLYVLCRSGNRAKQACDKVLAAGHTDVYVVEGGTLAWEKAGLPVNRGKQTMSLERQVRIANGFLILLGGALGYFVHPYLIGLSAFIGAGLMFAGITETCGMAMLLARMPWNQVGGSSGQSCGKK
ncbi:MAG TPA: rhodanese-like domain-containing protein [Planctomycetaceae bacterium]|nr:rhodanese-like domain-containing protein [Planctomycetaceae bacterium]